MTESEEIKDRLPIEQVVGRYIPLKKAGRIFKANCPFHSEKTPSFTVNPERGIFKCFGCNEGGDIFDFVMKIEGLTFPETIKLLAEQAGVQLKEPERKGGDRTPDGPAKPRLYQLNAYVAKLWHTILAQHPKAEHARAYVRSRGLADKTIVDFQIGFAPGGTTTAAGLQKAGFTTQETKAAGDPARFQDRIVFPICDITGKVVGFTGRQLETPGREPQGPKYWNTPETPLFIKSKAVFGLHLAKHAIQGENLAILAEGQMDVVMLHQAGYANAVASSGTALTSQQLLLLGRFTDTVAFAYDQDKAGIEATKRGIELVLAAELNPYVIVVPNGKDPADCIQQAPESWKEAYENRLPFMEWLMEQHIPAGEALGPIQKKEAAKNLLPWISRLKDPVEQGEWLRIAAARLQTDEENLKLALGRVAKPVQRQQQSPEEPQENLPPKQVELPPLVQRAQLALALLLSFPGIEPTVRTQLSDLRLAGTSPFIEQYLPMLEGKPADAELERYLKEKLSEDEQKELYLQAEAILKPYEEVDMDAARALEEFMLIAQRIRSDAKEEAKAHLAQAIRQAQAAGDAAKLQELFAELKNLI